MNRAYIGALMELAEKDQSVLHLLADSGTGYDELFRRSFPDRMFNFGIGEENMTAAAAGMAAAGKMPFVFTAGAFLAYRSFEFIRDDICFQNLNVKITGMGSGLSWSSLGPTHHTTEDIAVLRPLPNLFLLSAATPLQAAACVRWAHGHTGPVYLRIEMNNEQEFYNEGYELPADGMDVLREGTDAVVYVTGSILREAAEAARLLEQDGILVRLVNVSILKPFAWQRVREDARRCRHVFTIEEHNIHGGLGSLAAEALTYHGSMDGILLHPIGLADCFAQGYGTLAAVRKANGLDAAGLHAEILAQLRGGTA